MKLRLSILLLAAALAASPAAGQTIKSLGYNTTNGQVVYSGTNPLTFTNPLAFGDTTNTASIRTNLGLGATNYPVFRGLEITDGDTLYINPYNINADTFGLVLNFEERNFAQDGATVFEWSTNSFTVTPNATLNGVNNTAPSQTADSASSLMTRSLSDAQSLQLSVRPHNSGFVSFFGGSTTTATNGAAITQNQLARVSSGNAANNISRLQNRDILPVGLGAGQNAAIDFSQNLEFGVTGLFAHNYVANATTRIMFGGTNGYISGTNVARHVGWRADGANNVYATFGDGTNYTEILATNTTQTQKWWHIAANNGSVVWSIDGTQVASTTNGPNSSGGTMKLLLSGKCGS
jgi:hypothetical protein